MIERNLGNMERIVRLLAGLLFLVWAVSRPHLNGVEWFVIVVSCCLVMNGIFSRCYLWYVLDINTCKSGDKDCIPDATCP